MIGTKRNSDIVDIREKEYDDVDFDFSLKLFKIFRDF